MESRAVLAKYGATLVPLFSEINSLVKNAIKEGRDELDEEEISHVLKISGRMVHELRKDLEMESKVERV